MKIATVVVQGYRPGLAVESLESGPAEGIFTVLVEKIDLFLKFKRTRPVVIAFTNREISAPLPRVSTNWCRTPSLRVLIFGLVNGFDEAWIPRFVFANNVRRVVGGSIIVNQYLDSYILSGLSPAPMLISPVC